MLLDPFQKLLVMGGGSLIVCDCSGECGVSVVFSFSIAMRFPSIGTSLSSPSQVSVLHAVQMLVMSRSIKYLVVGCMVVCSLFYVLDGFLDSDTLADGGVRGVVYLCCYGMGCGVVSLFDGVCYL